MRKIGLFLVVRAADESTRVNSYTWTKSEMQMILRHCDSLGVIFLKWFGYGLYTLLYIYIFNITYILVYYCMEQAARPFSSVFEYGFPSSEVGYVSSLGYN